MKSYANLKKQLLKEREVRKAYQDLEPEFALAQAIIEHRIAKGMTQRINPYISKTLKGKNIFYSKC